MFTDTGHQIPTADIFAPADRSDHFIFDVDISTHDGLQAGVLVLFTAQVAVTDCDSLLDASQIALAMAWRHGYPTAIRLASVHI